MWKTSLIMVLLSLVGCSVVEETIDKVENVIGVEYHVRCTYKVTCLPGPEVVDEFSEDKCMSNEGQHADRTGWNEDCNALWHSINADDPTRCVIAKCGWDCYQTESLPCL